MGVFGDGDAVRRVYLGLFSLQHRGQESAGIACADPARPERGIEKHLDMGLVTEVFPPERLERLRGTHAIGHVRYSTAGGSLLCNAQPMVVRCARGELGVAHNGNLTNMTALRAELTARGSIFQSTADSEIIVHLLAQPSPLSFEEHLLAALRRLEGAYSLLFVTPSSVIAARDPLGFRPLWLGRLPGGAPCFASETCALAIAGAEPERELEPGEVVLADRGGVRSLRIEASRPRAAQCIFEHVYFARPDSAVFGDSVHDVRKRLGRRLAREHPVAADVVVPIPDSGNAAALGYSEESKVPYDLGFVRSHYVGRTFIKPSQLERQEGVSLKLAVVRAAVDGKRVVVVDDSIVRGNTARSRVRLLRKAGAREVHLRISCPPIRHPCFFGIDFPTEEELIANTHAPEAIARVLEADSVGYLSIEGMFSCVTGARERYCDACWSGRYPVDVRRGGEGREVG
jgi:amidophosphoribosyltransferase